MTLKLKFEFERMQLSKEAPLKEQELNLLPMSVQRMNLHPLNEDQAKLAHSKMQSSKTSPSQEVDGGQCIVILR